MTKFRRIALLCLFFFIAWPQLNANAAEEKPGSVDELSSPFSDYTPPPEEGDIAEEEHFIYFGNHYGISLGSGIQWFDGNIGKLYNAAAAQDLLFFNFWWMFNFRLWGQVGYSQIKHRYFADPIGDTEVNMQRYTFDLKYYFDSKNYSAAFTAMHPYAIGGIGRISRFQMFNTLNSLEWDNPLVFSGGLGIEYDIEPRKTRINFEGRLHRLRFKDADDATFTELGIPDLNGNMYSFTTSFIWMF